MHFCTQQKTFKIYKMPYARKNNKRRVMRRKRTMRPRGRVSLATKKYVKAAIHKQIENKVIVSNLANQSLPTALIGTDPWHLNLLPLISEGAEQGERSGVVVTPRRCVIKGFVNLKPYNASTNPHQPIKLKMWLLSYKLANRNAATFASGTFDEFFEGGNSAFPFQGNMLDMILPVNRQQWTVHSQRMINLGSTYGSTGSGSIVHDNSRFSVPFSFNVGKYLKTKLKFDDTDTDRCTNRNMWLVVQAVSAEGSTGIAYVTSEIHYAYEFQFEDA